MPTPYERVPEIKDCYFDNQIVE